MSTSGSSGEMTAEFLALLAEKVGAAAAYLREHPEMPGWVVWQTASFYPGFRPAEAPPALAGAAREHGLFLQTVAVTTVGGPQFFLLALRSADTTPDQVEQVLAAFGTPVKLSRGPGR